jgi:uncharacterized membrane protein (UPF0127 family)
MITKRDKIKEPIKYRIIHNDKMTNIEVLRIKDLKQHFGALVKRREIDPNQGYFKYKTDMFGSYFIEDESDIAFVSDDGDIIDYYKDFKPNSLTKLNPNAKFVYIFGKNTFKLNRIKKDDNLFHQK